MAFTRNAEYYVPLDDYIGIERLVSLDGLLKSKLDALHRDPRKQTKQFTAGERLDPAAPPRSGTRAINLRNQINGGYDSIHDAACWEDSEDSADFPELMEFVRTLPFVSFGRYFIIFDYDGIAEPPHRDHGDPNLRQEFIWFRTNKAKKFYLYERATRQNHYVDSYSCWFDTRHYHGTDPTDGLALSIRVDGVFTEEMRAVIAGYESLVPPRDLTIAEKVKRRLYFFRQNVFKKPHPTANSAQARSL